MAKLSEYLKGKESNSGSDDGGSKKKAIIRLKIAMLAKKVSKSKDSAVKSAFADHLEKSGCKK